MALPCPERTGTPVPTVQRRPATDATPPWLWPLHGCWWWWRGRRQRRQRGRRHDIHRGWLHFLPRRIDRLLLRWLGRRLLKLRSELGCWLELDTTLVARTHTPRQSHHAHHTLRRRRRRRLHGRLRVPSKPASIKRRRRRRRHRCRHRRASTRVIFSAGSYRGSVGGAAAGVGGEAGVGVAGAGWRGRAER